MSKSAWLALEAHYSKVMSERISDFFVQDPGRFSRFSLQACDLLLDYSKQHVTEETQKKLVELSIANKVPEAIQTLFSGGLVNVSEQRPALHWALRDQSSNPIDMAGSNIKPLIQNELAKLERFVDAIRSGKHVGATGSPIQQVVCLGIGGSDLGPSLVCEALMPYRQTDIQIHFIANLDGQSLAQTLSRLKPETTLCVINSKTFTTLETLTNAAEMKKWFQQALGDNYPEQHLVAATAAPEKAVQFGVSEKNIFQFWDFVGGRYSVWSTVGLPIALLVGMQNFRAFLTGGYEMDRHFKTAPLEQNMPVLMALLGVWNTNFFQYATQAIIPYADALEKFPSYLQQLEMESNGKQAAREQGFVACKTSPIVWGGVGCNSQHAYMQLLHQGTQVVPVDFLIAAKGEHEYSQHQRLLLASCLSQSKALMEGEQTNDAAKHCPGNRPSSTLMFEKLTPKVLGSLIALYEHKVFVQGVLWNINSFDQWGVQLGKQLVSKILPELIEQTSHSTLDVSTQGLIDFVRSKAN